MTRRPLLALALLRLALGAVFAAHGFQAIFVQGLSSVTGQFQAWNVPLPLLTAPLVATLQLAGGLLLCLGLGTRPIAALLSGVMALTLYFTPWNRIFSGGNGTAEALLLGVGALALALGGPGEPAFDQLMRQEGQEAGPPASRAARPGAKAASQKMKS
ncbi:DoxX family membrane protein [Deinococcus cavernae]|uniref:DoxX family membrane protein n=1 Tax=Deinococcus cavernae TaxID=2320857 RepID=A0A418V520_9DEIO|nr:DoxX family membrane protein [Deinococcus cavernae]RJF71204.1 DoxX family membrane protein [Deinococcus cavernae]